MSEDLREFTEGFFKNLGSTLTTQGELVVIENVPAPFEAQYGKKAPYYLSFGTSADERAEIVTRGSFLLKTMFAYLEQRGQTSVLKLDFERDFLQEFKHHLQIRNAHISSLNKTATYQSIVRLTFATTLQYLNEKEHITTTLFVRDGSIVPFVLEKYNVVEGSSKDASSEAFKVAYELAKQELKKVLAPRITETAQILKERLAREQTRIKAHYEQQRAEFVRAQTKLEEQITQLKQQAMKGKIGETGAISQKIARVEESLRELQHSDALPKLATEEQFFLGDEARKHGLHIDNKLLNTSIIYYPIFDFTLYLKGNEVARQLSLQYNPLDDVLSEIACESCKRVITEIVVCSGAHVSCSACAQRCGGCERVLCRQCPRKLCDDCGRKLCRKCMMKCTLCFMSLCQRHLHENYASGKLACGDCLKACSRCGKFADSKHRSQTAGGWICAACGRLGFLKEQR